MVGRGKEEEGEEELGAGGGGGEVEAFLREEFVDGRGIT